MIHYLITPSHSSSHYAIKERGLFSYHNFNEKHYDSAYQALKELTEILHGASAIIRIKE